MGAGLPEFQDVADTDSLQLARRIVRALSRNMDHVVLAPGSRSAPLAYALAEAEQQGLLQVHVRIDERSAAFTALGIAIATRAPAGVVTTSGTAVGNLMPAVMEADLSAASLVAITADRPEELHGTGANQTVWQRGMFAGRVRGEMHLEQGVPLATAQEQTEQLLHEVTGPVHLNIGFADPLVPNSGVPELASPDQPEQPLTETKITTTLPAPTSEAATPGIETTKTTRTVFVLGHDAPAEAAVIAQQGGHPVLAEPSSGFRAGSGAEVARAVRAYPLLLNATEGPAADLRAEVQQVVVAGRPTLIRGVQRLIRQRGLDQQSVEAVQYEPEPAAWHDERLSRPVIDSAQALAQWAGVAEPGWSQQWQQLGDQAASAVKGALTRDAETEGLSSVLAAQQVAETVRTPLLLGSSSVIRDVDLAADLSGCPQVFAMRGLAGIDGNLSAAVGLSLGLNRRVTALVGDLTALHDSNALLVPATEVSPDLDIVVMNDGGGAIFDQLEHGQVGRRTGMAETVERLFGTPQTVDFAALAQAHHLQYRLVRTAEELTDALLEPESGADSSPGLGIRLIEVRTDRRRLRDLHAQIAAEFASLSQQI